MTKKEIYKIARAIAHSERAGNLDKNQSLELRMTFSMALYQMNNKFDINQFHKLIDAVWNEMYEEFQRDQLA